MPRGGVPLGLTIADEFNIPLDVILAKKIGHQMNSEFAIGAIAEGGEPLMNDDKYVILVDNGIATRHTMFASIESVCSKKPLSNSAAVPIIPEDTFKALEKVEDNIYFVQIPEAFLGSVSAYYDNFPQFDGYNVQHLLVKK